MNHLQKGNGEFTRIDFWYTSSSHYSHKSDPIIQPPKSQISHRLMPPNVLETKHSKTTQDTNLPRLKRTYATLAKFKPLKTLLRPCHHSLPFCTYTIFVSKIPS